MRFRFLLLSMPLVLGACSKTAGPVRLDFIGTTGLTSGNRTVSPTDTLTTRAYAVGNDNDLRRLRITVKYEPTRNPIVYPTPLSSYDPTKTANDDALVYLDSLIVPIRTRRSDAPRGGEMLFVNRFTARSTSGTELWQYIVTDALGQTASRAYRLTARKTDSAAVVHSYTTRLRPVVRTTPAAPDSVRAQARVFLNLRSGLLLPKYAVLNNENSLQTNQQLIDLIAVANNNTVSLVAPASTALGLNTTKWPVANQRRTQLRQTGLTATDFNNASTSAVFAAAFAGGTTFNDPFNTGTLGKGQVVAFTVTEVGEGNISHDYAGLLLVSDLVLGTSPTLTCAVKVQK